MNDFEEKGSKDFRRLTVDQAVGLKYGEIVISVQKVYKSGNTVTKIDVLASRADKVAKVNYMV